MRLQRLHRLYRHTSHSAYVDANADGHSCADVSGGCIWVATFRYADGDAFGDADDRSYNHAGADISCDGDADGNTDHVADAHCCADSYADSFADGDSDGNTDGNANGNAYSITDCDAITVTAVTAGYASAVVTTRRAYVHSRGTARCYIYLGQRTICDKLLH